MVDARFGQYYWITLTAPGADQLPWDPGACTHPAEVPCSGELGCVVDAFDAAVWNGFAPRRWSWFITYLRRLLGDHFEFCGVWEYQHRGVLHRHFLIRLTQPMPERRVRAAIRHTSRRWGFGSQYDVRAISGDAARECWYIAKYSAKTADSIDGRTVLDRRTGELKDTRGFRPWSCSRSWGESMKSIRQRQAAWARGAAGGDGVDVADPGPGDGAAGALDPNPDISTIGTPIGVGALAVSASAALL